MSEPSLAIQIAIRSALVTAPAVTGMVPAEQIFDGPSRPELFPCVIVGTGQTVVEPITMTRRHVRVYHDLHFWTDESGLENLKQITGAAHKALAAKPAVADFRLIDWQVTGTRFMRDPGNVGHAVMTVEALVSEYMQ